MGIREELLKDHARMVCKLQNRHPLTLSLRFFANFIISFFLGGLPVIGGWGSMWIHTSPAPTAHMVNGMLGWSLILLWWGYCMRVQYSIGIKGMPTESMFKHRSRLILLYGHQIMWMALTVEAVLLSVKAVVWWASWR